MSEIKAFVGHSFSTDDARVASAFLKYFDQLAKTLPSFSWEHAEAAEPRELREKVLSIIAGKNVFIGICTKRERVAPATTSGWWPFSRRHKLFHEDSLAWKTSDWIVQEIGLAIGRGLALILLVEDGLRPPGGLQGDIEYISFNPREPEKVFGKILEMISALSPKSIGPATIDVLSNSADISTASNKDEMDWTKPQPNWRMRDYSNAFYYLTLTDRHNDAVKIDAAFQATAEADLDGNKAAWLARTEGIRILAGNAGDLERLRSIADDNPTNRDVLFYLGMGLQNYGAFSEAAHSFGRAAFAAKDDTDKYDLLGYAAINLAKSGNKAATLAMVDTLRGAARSNAKIERQILGDLRSVVEIMKDNEADVAIMERIVEINPNDVDTRSSLAYKHSELGNDDLALYHYLKIPFDERNAGTWNNLGVAFNQFEMPSKCVDAYQKAAALGDTLAMSNLGHRLMEVGFLREAGQQFDQALATGDYHKNIGTNITRLKEIPEEEDKKEEELLRAVRKKAEFYTRLGRAVSQPTPAHIVEYWLGPVCGLRVTKSGDKIRAMGTYEMADPNYQLFAALGGGPEPTTKYCILYEGTLTGKMIEGTVQRTKEAPVPSTAPTSLIGLGLFGDPSLKVLMAIADDGTARVIEEPNTSKPKFYRLRPVSEPR